MEIIRLEMDYAEPLPLTLISDRELSDSERTLLDEILATWPETRARARVGRSSIGLDYGAMRDWQTLGRKSSSSASGFPANGSSRYPSGSPPSFHHCGGSRLVATS